MTAVVLKRKLRNFPTGNSASASRRRRASRGSAPRLAGPAQSVSLPLSGSKRGAAKWTRRRANEIAAEPARRESGYAAVGEHVSGHPRSGRRGREADSRRGARRGMRESQRLAAVEAERLKKELTEDARNLRAEAEEYARDMRSAGLRRTRPQHRRQAEEEARKLVAEAEEAGELDARVGRPDGPAAESRRPPPPGAAPRRGADARAAEARGRRAAAGGRGPLSRTSSRGPSATSRSSATSRPSRRSAAVGDQQLESSADRASTSLT